MPPPLPARVWPTASSGSVRLEFCPFLVLRHEIPAAGHRSAQAKRRGPKPSISPRLCWWPSTTWRHPPRARDTAMGSASGLSGIRVDKRVLPVMRENNLLSPHRRRRGGNPHVGEIITHAPNLMWGTDGVVFTVDDGWGWIFTAIEHWNAECVGWHVCKRGDRFAALQDLHGACVYASTSAGAARGLALRMDHGSQYLSATSPTRSSSGASSRPTPRRTAPDQRRPRGSHAQEQIIHGRIYRNIAELRNAVRGFVEQYNARRGEERLPGLKLVRRGTPRCHSGPPMSSKEPGAYMKMPAQCGLAAQATIDGVLNKKLRPGI